MVAKLVAAGARPRALALGIQAGMTRGDCRFESCPSNWHKKTSEGTGMIAEIRAEIRSNGEYRFGRWGTFWHRFSIAHWRWSVAICKFEDHWSLHLLCLWITLWRTRVAPREIMESWGFTLDLHESRSLHLNWGHRTKIVHLPWSLEWVRTEHGMPDGSFFTVEQESRWPRRFGGKRLYRRADGSLQPGRKYDPTRQREYIDSHTAAKPARYRETFPYRYVLRNGTVQERTATVTTSRMTWAYRLPWLFGIFWPRKVSTSIRVEFSDEVGEGSGSWKGGTVGCGYELLPGETPESCLRRMEREREFKR